MRAPQATTVSKLSGLDAVDYERLSELGAAGLRCKRNASAAGIAITRTVRCDAAGAVYPLALCAFDNCSSACRTVRHPRAAARRPACPHGATLQKKGHGQTMHVAEKALWSRVWGCIAGTTT